MLTRRVLWMLAVLAAPTMAALVTGRAAADIAGCPVFPADNIWNTRVDTLPVHALSDAYVDSIGRNTRLHPDFGAFVDPSTGEPIGIPFITVPGTQASVPINFTDFGDESDPGPYPIPPNAPIEGGPTSAGDRHVLVIDVGHCVLYELFNAFGPFPSDNHWDASSGAKFDLFSNVLRPDGFTSADAAGLAIFPGLVRLDEANAGAIRHALRFTARITQQAHVWPARHDAGSTTSPLVPPMGQRFRLKAAADLTGFSPRIQAIFQAFKAYGLILADNGSNWFISGTQDAGWDDDELVAAFAQLTGANFEAVDASSLLIDPNSGQARPPGPTPPPILTVSQAGTGSGTVTSVPAGIACGPACMAAYAPGTTVTLSATAAAGSMFAGWGGGGCSGTGLCVLTLNANTTVLASFDLVPSGSVALTVATAGSGTGTVTSVPAGIACGTDCNEAYPAGTVVTLTAMPGAGFAFGGWSGGGCGGTGPCTVTLTVNTIVAAVFTPAGRSVITTPVDGSRFPLAGPTPVTFTWTALPGVLTYGFEFTVPNRPFANPNGTAPDGVNGFGGAGGGIPVQATSFTAVLTPEFPQGTYQVRVIGLTAGGQPTGTFSDAVTLTLGPGGPVGGAGRVSITAPVGGSTLQRGVARTFAWTALTGVTQYFFEFTGPNRAFTNPNGTTTDPGAAGAFTVAATNFTAVIPATIAAGSYQVRVIGLGPTGQFLGSFSDAVTVVVQ